MTFQRGRLNRCGISSWSEWPWTTVSPRPIPPKPPPPKESSSTSTCAQPSSTWTWHPRAGFPWAIFSGARKFSAYHVPGALMASRWSPTCQVAKFELQRTCQHAAIFGLSGRRFQLGLERVTSRPAGSTTSTTSRTRRRSLLVTRNGGRLAASATFKRSLTKRLSWNSITTYDERCAGCCTPRKVFRRNSFAPSSIYSESELCFTFVIVVGFRKFSCRFSM